MTPKIYRHLWGIQGELTDFLGRCEKTNLYQGIEAGLIWLSPRQKSELQSFLNHSERINSYIGMIFTDTPMRPSFDWADHVETFKSQLDEVLALNPVLINVHSGSDFFSTAEEEKFFAAVLGHVKSLSLPIPVVHETHRGRILFHPKKALELLQKFPDLQLCLDVSHWICTCERLLNRVEDELWWPTILERTKHVHARIGYEQGPQIPNLEDKIWEEQRIFSEGLWKKIRPLTLTPEYGPFPYATMELDKVHKGTHFLEESIDKEALRLHEIFSSSERQKSK